jgi:hypothetical protein
LKYVKGNKPHFLVSPYCGIILLLKKEEENDDTVPRSIGVTCQRSLQTPKLI